MYEEVDENCWEDGYWIASEAIESKIGYDISDKLLAYMANIRH